MRFKTLTTTLLTAGALSLAAPAMAVDPSVPAVDETHQAALGMYAPGTFPALADVPDLYIHEFNAEEPENNPLVNKHTVGLDSVINYFTVEHPDRPASAQFGVQGDRTVQFMNVGPGGGDTAYAQGYANFTGVSIETYGAQDEATKQEVATLIWQLEVLKGGEFTLKTHDMEMPTQCGDDVDLQDYTNRVNALHEQHHTLGR